MSNRTHYTSSVTMTARELSAIRRFLGQRSVVGDQSLVDEVLYRLTISALLSSTEGEIIVDAAVVGE